ncbi:MAG: ribosomal L7Ae/L30e/S12e/Gadd45 family protein [bacterium]|jgi:ribosomal protein L7Ae-like RNA K-turn-binding protein
MLKFAFWLMIAMKALIIILDNYKKIVKALCKENNVPLMTIKTGTSLGEYIGICKYDS